MRVAEKVRWPEKKCGYDRVLYYNTVVLFQGRAKAGGGGSLSEFAPVVMANLLISFFALFFARSGAAVRPRDTTPPPMSDFVSMRRQLKKKMCVA